MERIVATLIAGTVLFAATELFAQAPAAAPPITAIAFAPDGESLLVGSQAGLVRVDWPSLKPAKRLDTQLDHIHDLAFSPAGDRLLAAGGAAAEQGSVEVWSWPEAKRIAVHNLHEDLACSVSWQPDGKGWASAGMDRMVVVQRANNKPAGEPLTLAGHSRGVLACAHLGTMADSPFARLLVSAGIDQTLRVWDLAQGRLVRGLNNHTESVVGLAVRPSQSSTALPVVASISDDRTVRFWQPTIGRLMRFARVESQPLCVSWTADGRYCLVGNSEGRLLAIDPDTVEQAAEIPVLEGWLYSLAISPDGRRCVAGGSGGVLRRVDLTQVAQ